MDLTLPRVVRGLEAFERLAMANPNDLHDGTAQAYSRPFAWTEQRTRAAQLVAEGRLNLEQIAAQAECDRRTLYNWRQCPEFAAQVAEIVEQYRVDLREKSLLNLRAREQIFWEKFDSDHPVDLGTSRTRKTRKLRAQPKGSSGSHLARKSPPQRHSHRASTGTAQVEEPSTLPTVQEAQQPELVTAE